MVYICSIQNERQTNSLIFRSRRQLHNTAKIIMQVSNQTIKVTANQSARTFTIRTYVNGKFSNKYRTIQFSKEEFSENEYNTENDWKEFLKSSDYYKVN